MASSARLRKDTDYETRFRCSGGIGIVREEVWVDGHGQVVRYNLAFLLPHRFRRDNGRVLGFDNAHGIHERHFMGNATKVSFTNYSATARRFFREAESLRRSYEDENPHRRL
jgi:hypothetical protein